MNQSPPHVVLLRSADDPDPYLQAFSDAGFRAACTPVLAFDFLNTEALHARLRQSDRYGGLIATSPRVGRALRLVFDEERSLQSLWQERTAFAVGPKTAESLRALSFDVQGEKTGTAAELAAYIAESDPSGPLLFLCGNRRREDLPEGLRAAGVAFEELVVYETRLREDLSLPPPAEGRWLVFFSPSGLEAVRRAETGSLSAYRCAAIGPTTAASLEEAGVVSEAVASSPTPEGVVEAIRAAEED